MSVASPFKQNRIDRHLSRQRGAGVRNLTTSFGFSFGPSATTATEPITSDSVTIEPAQKRRKCSHHTEEETAVRVLEHALGSSLDDAAAAKDHSDKAANELEPRAVSIPVGDEKAVGSSAQSRKGPTKRGRPKASKAINGKSKRRAVEALEDNVHEDAEPEKLYAGQTEARQARTKKAAHVEPEESAVTSRPRRRAATNAMSKVTQGFLEEEAPIDKKRRDPVPEKARRRGYKVNAVSEEVSPRQAQSSEVDPEAASICGEIGKDVVIDQKSRRPQTTETRPRRVRKPDTTVYQEHELNEEPIAKEARLLPAAPNAEKSSLTKTQRRPLVETDVNMRSVSPEKRDYSKTQAKECKAEEQEPLALDEKREVKRPRKRAKIAGDYDAAPNVDSERQRIESTGPTKTRSKAVDRGPAPRKKRLLEESTLLQRKVVDEDVDWLFDIEQPRKRTVKARAHAAVTRVTRQALAKLPDVDLDDLLTDIAYIAHKPGQDK